MCGVLLICLLAPPIRTSIGNEAFKGDWRLSLLALGLLVSYGVVLSVAPLRTLFDLMPLRMSDYALIGTGVIAWGTGLRWAWRVRLLERLLQVDGR